MDNIDNYISQVKKQNEKQVYKLWECAICGERYSCAEYLETHLRACHEDAFDSPPVVAESDWKPTMCFHDNVNDKQSARWSCSMCHMLFFDTDTALAHGRETGHDIRSIPKLPPLGLMPKDIWESKRIEAILDAIKRFRNEEQNIPGEWLDELTELWGRQKVKQQ